MSHIVTSTHFRGLSQAASRSLPLFKVCMPHVKHMLKLTFVSGPMQLLTSRITGKCATFMILMCAPALLACSLLTLPGLIFKSPQQHAYFYFSSMLEQDPTRWMVLLLAGTCALLSLAVPATMPAPKTPIRY